MRALVIGAGYLGGRVAESWRRDGHEVWITTRSADRARQAERAGFRAAVADVVEPGSLKSLPECDVLLYAVGFDRRAGVDRETVMLGGVQNVVDAMRGRAGRFLYVSTAGVYGQNRGEWVDEHSPCEPATEGGRCCLAAEGLVREAFPNAATVLRLAGLYGPGRLLRRVESLQSGEPIAGRPDAWLNLIHVDDAVTAVRAVAARANPAETYVVVDDEPVPRQGYFTLLANLVGAPPPVFDVDRPTRHGAGGVNKRLSNRRLREDLGVELRFPTLREGLPQAVR